MSLLPALLIVSWQFFFIDKMFPLIYKGAYIDDRNYQGPMLQIIQLDDIVAKFDLAAGLFTQHDKTEFILTDQSERTQLLKMNLNGHVPKCPTAIKMVGYLIMAARYKITKLANDRASKTLECAKVVASAPLNMAKKIKATMGKTVPSFAFATNWSAPSMALASRLRSKVFSCI